MWCSYMNPQDFLGILRVSHLYSPGCSIPWGQQSDCWLHATSWIWTKGKNTDSHQGNWGQHADSGEAPFLVAFKSCLLYHSGAIYCSLNAVPPCVMCCEHPWGYLWSLRLIPVPLQLFNFLMESAVSVISANLIIRQTLGIIIGCAVWWFWNSPSV